MTKVALDLSNVKDFEAVPAGKYQCIIESIVYKMSKSENPMLSWKLAISEGEKEGQKLFLNTSLQPKALFKLKAVFEGLGLPGDFVGELDYDEETGELIEPNMIGVAVLASVSTRLYEGKTQNQVDDIIAANKLTAGAKGKPGARRLA